MRTARTQLLPLKGGEGTSDNEEEDTDDIATVDDINEGGYKKTTAKTLIADSEPGNNNGDSTNNDGDGNNKNENDDENDDENENENEDDNGNEEKESENEDENENEDGNENPSTTKNNPTTSPHGTTPPPDSSTLDPIGGLASKTLPSQPGPPADPAILHHVLPRRNNVSP
jgi:mediator of RNA polymerase II transcription subunit 2